MANNGVEHLLFLFTVHALLTYGAAHGIIGQDQAGQSQKFVSTIQKGQLMNSTDVGDESGITQNINLAIKSVPVIGDLYNLLTTPYGLMLNSNLPNLIKLLVTGFMSVIELGIMVKVIRGIDL